MPRAPGYSEDEVRRAVAQARCYSDALRALGLRPAGGNYRTLKRLIAHYGLSTDHFDPDWARRGTPPVQAAVPLSEVLVQGSSYGRTSLKRRLFDEGYKARRCELCGQGEHWNGAYMSLILDHINGVSDDNRLENLRIVCPNCNATLDTHCGRQNRNGPRDCLRCGTEFQPASSRQQYCSRRCRIRHPRKGELRPEIRKVERPSYSELLAELEASNYSAVGRKYGVSDNAVRKWVRAYEYQASRTRETGGAVSHVMAPSIPPVIR